MEALVRLKLRPLGVWTTPWQADSLLGSMANLWARSRGVDALMRDFIQPWLDHAPPFVISDAFPGDSLPTPANLALAWDWPPDRRKDVKKLCRLSPRSFKAAQKGESPNLEDDLKDTSSVSIRHHIRMRNSTSRETDSANEEDGLFEVEYSDLSDPDSVLTLYARATSDGVETLTRALEMLGEAGYGARASTGHGGFDVDGEPEPCAELDDVPGADGFVSLSTFQPAPTDPVEGYWRSFVKYGKMAPEFHSSNIVFKRPQVMLEAGACFRTKGAPRPFYGRAIGPERLLRDGDRNTLEGRGISPVQAAFALAVPMVWRG